MGIYRQYVEWVREALLAKNDAMLPPKQALHLSGNRFLTSMPCAIPVQGYGGVKIVTRQPGRWPAIKADISLYEFQRMERFLWIDGAEITSKRTGAMAALCVDLFARKGWKTIGMIGLGETARAFLHCLSPEHEITIKLREYKNQHEIFAGEFSDKKNITFQTVYNNEDLVRGSDIVVSAVTATSEAIARPEWFDYGCLLLPIHTRGFEKCDTVFEKVYCDDKGHVAGFGNYGKFQELYEVTEVLEDRAPGREDDKERIICYNVGIALLDIWFAKKHFDGEF